LAKGKLLPNSFGISANGNQFLNEIVKANVLIDVKHMSLVSRQVLYQNEGWSRKPLLSSHAGVTG